MKQKVSKRVQNTRALSLLHRVNRVLRGFICVITLSALHFLSACDVLFVFRLWSLILRFALC